MSFTIGSLCSGYGGLDMAVESFFDAETAWFAEYEAAPSKVLAHHWPDVPNYGDMTAIDWASVPKVDIVTGGTPCQDLSAAGRRRGMTEGTRSNLWVQMRECIAAVRPSVVIWENVRGAYSAHATSEVEHEPGLLGEPYGPGRPALRALHRVLGDLADLGFDAEWVGVRASDAGAPHGRFRVFVVAYAADLGHERAGVAWDWRDGLANRDQPSTDPRRVGGREGNATSERGPEVADRSGVVVERGVDDHGTDWGEYEPAVIRWEAIFGRPAPIPRVNDRLNPRLAEWMMGLPDGWVTAPEIGLTWNEQLKALGNGVVPQQAELALSHAWERLADVRTEVAA